MTDASVVVFCADAGYVVPLAVALRSLASSTRDPERVTVIVLSVGIPAVHHDRLRRAAHPLSVQFVEIDELLPADLPLTGHFTMATYGRLWAVDALPRSVTRAVYLDADVLVLDDLGPLFDVAVSTQGIAAVQDVGIPHVSNPSGLSRWRTLGIDPTTPYCNAGVMVIDPDRWRASRLTERVLTHIRRDPANVTLNEQDGLNAVLRGDFAPLPLRWNQLDLLRRANHLGHTLFPADEIDDAVRRPAVIHYTAGPKPWQPGCTDPAAHRWQSTLAETPYRDVRLPDFTRRDRLIRAVGRAARRLSST